MKLGVERLDDSDCQGVPGCQGGAWNSLAQYMIDEMQDTIDAQKEQLKQKDEQLNQAIIQGIRAFILDNLEEGVPRERILLKLQKRFDLIWEKASAYLDGVAVNSNLGSKETQEERSGACARSEPVVLF